MTGRTFAARLLGVAARNRRYLGAVCAALALTGGVLLVRPTSAPAAEVLVATRALDALSPITAGDLAVRQLPIDAIPDDTLKPGDDPVGRSLAGPVTRGEVITRARIAVPPARGHGPGLVAAPVRVSESLPAGLLHPGSRVDVLAAAGDPAIADFGGGAQPAHRVVEDRPVVSVPQGAADSVGGSAKGALVVLAVRLDEARALAGHAAASRLTVTVRG